MACAAQEEEKLDLRPKLGSEEEEEPLDLRPKWGSEEEVDDDDDGDDDDESFGDVAGASDVLIQEMPWDVEEEDEDEDEEGDESWRNDPLYKETPNGLHEMNPKEYRKYFRHLEKSRGYDMPLFRKVMCCGIRPCYGVFSSSFILNEVVQSSKFALEQHNQKKGTKYELYKIMKVMEEPVSGTVYYITFQGEDLNRIGDTATSNDKVKVGPNGGPLVVLQAQVWYKLPDENRVCKMELLEFQVKDTLTEEDKS